MTVSPSKSKARRRLMALGNHVEKSAEEKAWGKYFDMSEWIGDVENIRSLPVGAEVEINNDCGTSACLLGHGVNVPLLRKAGLRTYVNWDGCVGNHATLAVVSPDEIVIGTYGSHGAFVVAKKLFGLSYERYQQVFLFQGRNNHMSSVRPKTAVRNLRRVVDEIDRSEGWEF